MVGRYLGPAIDDGPAMTSNIMKSNGEVVHQSTYGGLKEDKKSNQSHTSLRKKFDNSIRENLGLEILPDVFPYVNLEDTPLYEMYEDDTTYAEGGLADNTEDEEDPLMATGFDREVPTPEVNDNYVTLHSCCRKGIAMLEGS